MPPLDVACSPVAVIDYFNDIMDACRGDAQLRSAIADWWWMDSPKAGMIT